MTTRRIVTIITAILIIFLVSRVNVKAHNIETVKNNMIEYVIPDNYSSKGSDFRAVWISPLVSDIPRFTSEEQYKKEILSVFEVMKYYNLNVMIFHVRIYNDAFYQSNYNNWSSYYNTNPSWEALPWIIEECHKRGIEFHAWMNPYRVATTKSAGTDLATLAKKYPINNAASKASNLLIGSSTIILNPGIEEVKSFLVSTCMEVVRNYDVDAIHFDDYFYIEGLNNNDYDTYVKSMSPLPIEDWRRSNIDDFIKRLSTQIKSYNESKNKTVQLGISPSPVYRDGDGKVTYDDNGTAITSGSSTNQGGHYNAHLYCDTKKWVDNEWIDYIVPQCYLDFETTHTSFASCVDWWNKVVKNKKVNLYIGIGLYRAVSSSCTDWKKIDEFNNEMKYLSSMDYVKGIAIFSYRHIKYAYNKTNSTLVNQVQPVYDNSWSKINYLPVLQRFESVILDGVENLRIIKETDGFTLTFSRNDQARFYAVYRDSKLIDIFGGKGSNGTMTYKDKIDPNGEYKYSIRCLSNNNTIGDVSTIKSTDIYFKVTFVDTENNVLKEELVRANRSATAPEYTPSDGYKVVGWDNDFSNVTKDIKVMIVLEKEITSYNVKFYDFNNEVYEYTVKENETVVPPTLDDVIGYTFVKWDKDFTSITSDLEIKAIYEKNSYKVTFLDKDDNLLSEQDVLYEEDAKAPAVKEIIGYNFISWNKDFTNVKEDLTIKSIYEKKKFIVTYINEFEETIKKEMLYGDKIDISMPDEVEDYTFIGWYNDDTLVEDEKILEDNITLVAKWEKNVVKEPIEEGCTNLSIMRLLSLFTLFGVIIVKKKNNVL